MRCHCTAKKTIKIMAGLFFSPLDLYYFFIQNQYNMIYTILALSDSYISITIVITDKYMYLLIYHLENWFHRHLLGKNEEMQVDKDMQEFYHSCYFEKFDKNSLFITVPNYFICCPFSHT